MHSDEEQADDQPVGIGSRPIVSQVAVALDQIIRQAVAVVVIVPGIRSPALTIGEATHNAAAGHSIVKVAVANPGNVRLKPVVDFTLCSMPPEGGSARHVSDGFVLREHGQDVRAAEEAISLEVEAPATPLVADSVVPGLTEVNRGAGDGQIALPAWIVALTAGLALGTVVIGLIMLTRQRRRLP